MKDFKNIPKKKHSKFGFMFGPEAFLLSNKDLLFSNFIFQIFTSKKKFKSLNLYIYTIFVLKYLNLLIKNMFKTEEKIINNENKSFSY